MKTWDRVVTKAWLERNDPKSSRYHPAKAVRIYKRFASQIDGAGRWTTAKHMVEKYKNSDYTAVERANDHAISYSSTSWQYQFWKDVTEIILQIQKEAK